MKWSRNNIKSYIKDYNYLFTVEDEGTTGGNSELLLHKESEKRQYTTCTSKEDFREVKSDMDELKETRVSQSTAPAFKEGQEFLGKGHGINDSSNLELNDKDFFHEVSTPEVSSRFVGLGSSTNLERYPHDASIVAHTRDMCGLQRPKLISWTDIGLTTSHGVVVYEATQLENTSLQSDLNWFSKNVEHKVPEELVKIGQEEWSV